MVIPVVADNLADEDTEFFALGLRLPNVTLDPALIIKIGANRMAAASILNNSKCSIVQYKFFCML